MPTRRTWSPQTLRVLRMILRQSPEATYGYEIIQATRLPKGTVYRILKRLEAQGVLHSTWEDIDPSWAGRSRQHLYEVNRDSPLLAGFRTPAPSGKQLSKLLRKLRDELSFEDFAGLDGLSGVERRTLRDIGHEVNDCRQQAGRAYMLGGDAKAEALLSASKHAEEASLLLGLLADATRACA